jgi:ketosteroid isomerase-like protein
MTAPEDAVRARRRLTNKLIAAHEAGRLKPFLAPEVELIPAGGEPIAGADAVVAAFAAQFADPAFVTYVRTPETVTVDGDRAREHGDWVGRWRGPEGEETLSGVYEAVWRKSVGQWVIAWERYTPG